MAFRAVSANAVDRHPLERTFDICQLCQNAGTCVLVHALAKSLSPRSPYQYGPPHRPGPEHVSQPVLCRY